MRPTEADRLPETDAGFAERRRPGRQDAHPALLPLLRRSATMAQHAEGYAGTMEDGNPLGAARGLLVGLLVSLPIWALIVFGIRAVL